MNVEAWRESAAALDLSILSSNWCAMTCLRMLLLLHGKEALPLEQLFDSAHGAGVYQLKEDGNWAGAYHLPLRRFVSKFGFMVRLVREFSTHSLATALSRGMYVLLSVSPDIRFHTREEQPKKTNGHFVLTYGYTTDSGDRRHFLIQNAAGFASLHSQIGVPVSEARLSQVFSGRALLVRPQQLQTPHQLG